jgi:hypothetical protein
MIKPATILLSLILLAVTLTLTTGCVSVDINLPEGTGTPETIHYTTEEPLQVITPDTTEEPENENDTLQTDT